MASGPEVASFKQLLYLLFLTRTRRPRLNFHVKSRLEVLVHYHGPRYAHPWKGQWIVCSPASLQLHISTSSYHVQYYLVKSDVANMSASTFHDDRLSLLKPPGRIHPIRSFTLLFPSSSLTGNYIFVGEQGPVDQYLISSRREISYKTSQREPTNRFLSSGISSNTTA